MLSWIVVVILYLCGIGCFQLLGGLAGAADALERWGASSAVARGRGSSSPGR
ncbi:MAG TPA: hypothetical protein VFD90_00150 [Gaiellales bacterium]|jgi:hypothetical protein|nr:hypothetical protein [Gaiellales bacterium]